MGNLKQSMTEEEWDDLGRQIKKDKENGKPDSTLIYLSFGYLPLDKKIAVRRVLTPFFDGYDLREMDKWIQWDKKQELFCEKAKSNLKEKNL